MAPAVTVAALYVETGGVYYGLPDVDPWDEQRDARLYAGPWPVVAHPPCNRWSIMANGIETRFGYPVGDDGGCFRAALAAVRAFGGVIEHPAHSAAWRHFGLPVPRRWGGWYSRLDDQGWSCWVEQGNYGHPYRKPTWLYAYGVDLPQLAWGRGPGLSLQHRDPTMSQTQRLRLLLPTPPAFRDVLLAMARTATAPAPLTTTVALAGVVRA